MSTCRSLVLIALLLSRPAIAQPKLDAHGFPLPDGAMARIGDLHYTQSADIVASAISPDGAIVATARVFRDEKPRGCISEVHLWNAHRGEVLRTLKTADDVSMLTFSPDGRALASGTRDGKVTLWETKSGKLHWTTKDGKAGTTSRCVTLRFIDQGRSLACLHQERFSDSNSHQPAICLRSVSSGAIDRRYLAGELTLGPDIKADVGHFVADADLSPSGERMAWLVLRKGCDPAVLVHETKSGRLIDQMSIRSIQPECLHLLDEGETVLLQAKAANSVVRMIDGRENFEFPFRIRYFMSRPPGERLLSHLWAIPAGSRTFSVSDQYGVVHWNMDSGELLAENQNADAFSADGKRAIIVCGPQWTLLDGKFRHLSPAPRFWRAPWIHFENDHQLLLQNGDHSETWDTQRVSLVVKQSLHETPSIGRTPCASNLAGNRFVYHKVDKGLFVLERATKREFCLIANVPREQIYKVIPQFNRTGTRILVASPSDDNGLLVRWFDSQDGKELGRYAIAKNEYHGQLYRHLSWFADDGSTFGYIAPDCRLILVDCESRAPRSPIHPPSSVAADSESIFPTWEYTQDGPYVIASRRIRPTKQTERVVWEMSTGARLRRCAYPEDASVWISGVRRDSRLLAICDEGGLNLFETLTGRLLRRIRLDTDIHSAAFSPDGKLLATSHSDTTVLLWDMNRPLGDRPALPLPASDADCEKLWRTLADLDPATAEQAVWALVRAPTTAMAFLDTKMQPVREPPRLKDMIAQLDSADFKEREAAARALAELGEAAEPALRRELPKMSLEQRRRAEKILNGMDDPARPPVHLRELRAVEALERIATPAARRILARLAEGTKDSLLTNEARLALERCGGR